MFRFLSSFEFGWVSPIPKLQIFFQIILIGKKEMIVERNKNKNRSEIISFQDLMSLWFRSELDFFSHLGFIFERSFSSLAELKTVRRTIVKLGLAVILCFCESFWKSFQSSDNEGSRTRKFPNSVMQATSASHLFLIVAIFRLKVIMT